MLEFKDSCLIQYYCLHAKLHILLSNGGANQAETPPFIFSEGWIWPCKVRVERRVGAEAAFRASWCVWGSNLRRSLRASIFQSTHITALQEQKPVKATRSSRYAKPAEDSVCDYTPRLHALPCPPFPIFPGEKITWLCCVIWLKLHIVRLHLWVCRQLTGASARKVGPRCWWTSNLFRHGRSRLMQHTCSRCSIISWCRTMKRSNINREIAARERSRPREDEENTERESANVGMMSGRGVMHDGNTSHTRGACLWSNKPPAWRHGCTPVQEGRTQPFVLFVKMNSDTAASTAAWTFGESRSEKISGDKRRLKLKKNIIITNLL